MTGCWCANHHGRSPVVVEESSAVSKREGKRPSCSPHAASVWACRRVGSEAASRCARLLAAAEADCCSERRGLSVSGPHPEQSAVLHVTLMRADGLIVEECGGSHSGGACGRMHVEPKATRCGTAGGCSTWLRCRAAAHHWQCRLPTSRTARAARCKER